MSAAVVAVDCDLRKLYAWCSICGMVCKAAEGPRAIIEHVNVHESMRVIFEIAGATDYTDNKGIAHNKRRWTIFNVAMASRINDYVEDFLVAPSSVWTCGYPLDARHQLAKATAPQKDLRECQAMLWSYQRAPATWKPLDDFLARL